MLITFFFKVWKKIVCNYTTYNRSLGWEVANLLRFFYCNIHIINIYSHHYILLITLDWDNNMFPICMMSSHYFYPLSSKSKKEYNINHLCSSLSKIDPISWIMLQKGFCFLNSLLPTLCHFAFRVSRKELYGFTKFFAPFFSTKKTYFFFMEMVVSKLNKDITFSTVSFLLRMQII